MNKRKIVFLFTTIFISFSLQFIFFIFTLKIIDLFKIINIKNTFHKILLLSTNIESEIPGLKTDNNSFILSIPSVDINKTFVINSKDYVVINFNKSNLSFNLLPSEISARKNKSIKFINVKSVDINDCGFITFTCSINNEIIESIFYMNKNIYLFPDDFAVF